MLGTLQPAKNNRMEILCAPLVFVYHSTKHDITGFPPYYFLFGWEPRLSIDLILHLQESKLDTSYNGYIVALRKRIRYAHSVVDDRIRAKGEAREEWVRRCDMRLWCLETKWCCREWVFREENKLADRWAFDRVTCSTGRCQCSAFQLHRCCDAGEVGWFRPIWMQAVNHASSVSDKLVNLKGWS